MDEPIQKNEPQEEIRKEEDGELAKLTEERDEYLKGWQRAKADFVNYKREELKRIQDIAKYGQEELIREIIPILDSFDLGINAMEEKGEVEKGVYMIRSQMEDVLKRYGLEKISAKIGEPFDPRTDEAVVEIEGNGPPGSVAAEIEPGYRLHEKLIRPVRVKVIKPKQ